MPSTAPTITGTVSNQTTTFEKPLDPFSGVTIGDANAGATDTLSITLSGPGSLSGTGLSGSDGSYTLTGTAAAITSELRALSFTPVNGVLNTSVTTTFTLSDTSSAYSGDTYGPVSTLATFTGANGQEPEGGVTIDAAGDLFGTTATGGADGDGTVFEISKAAGELTTLATFTGAANGAFPQGGVTLDSAGDLFGTTELGGADSEGTVFEVSKATGELTTVATFTGANGSQPLGGLTIDAAGDLFGTTATGGADGDGTLFEISKATGELTTLASFTGANGSFPRGNLTIDAAGDLFGTTELGGANNDGTVFEVSKATGELTTLATFTGANGAKPFGGLTIDAAGDLFGTTSAGGADSDGTVFEISASTGELTTLATFTGANGADPFGGLTIDAAGDLFGTTSAGGADDDGTVFEIAKSTGELTTLASFTGGANSKNPYGGVTLDAAGDLLGLTINGGGTGATAFELPATSGLVPTVNTATTVADSDPSSYITWQNTSTGQVSVWDMDGNTRIGGGPVSNLGPAWKVVGTGDFNDDGEPDILWQNASTGQVSVWEMDGNTRIGGGPVSDLGPTWQAVGTGDFNDDGKSDILWQNTSTGQVSVWEMDGNTRIGAGRLAISGRLGRWSEPVTSTTTGSPTSCGRTRAPAKSRSGRWMGTPGSEVGRLAISGRVGKRSEPATSMATGIPTSFSRTQAPARSRSGRWMGTPGSEVGRLAISGRVGTPSHLSAAAPTSSFKTLAPARSRSGRWTAIPGSGAGRLAISGRLGKRST